MRQVWSDPARAREVGERGRQDIALQLSPEATGRHLRSRLERLAKRRQARGAAT
jgi:hypothetical protein